MGVFCYQWLHHTLRASKNNPNRKNKKIDLGCGKAERRARSAEGRAQSAEHRVQSAEHSAQSAEHRVQRSKHMAQSAKHRWQSAERRENYARYQKIRKRSNKNHEYDFYLYVRRSLKPPQDKKLEDHLLENNVSGIRAQTCCQKKRKENLQKNGFG